MGVSQSEWEVQCLEWEQQQLEWEVQCLELRVEVAMFLFLHLPRLLWISSGCQSH